MGPGRILGPNRNLHPRNSPDLFNRGVPAFETMFWDNRVAGTSGSGFVSPAGAQLPPAAEFDSVLAVLAMFPVTARDEMRGLPHDADIFNQPNELAEIEDDDFTAIWAGLMDRLLAIPEYQQLFAEAYPDVPTEELEFQHAANALAAFISVAFTFNDSSFDRYAEGDNDALGQSEKLGALLFLGDANCASCHSGNLFTDQQPHNLAIPQIGPGQKDEAPLDFGRFRESGNEADRFAFRTPPLRNVALTGPWMHNGAYTTLDAAVRHHLHPEQALRAYAVSQLRPNLRDSFQGDEVTFTMLLDTLDPLVSTPIMLTEAEVDDLLAFLDALTDPAAVDLSHLAPTAVPSGLTLDR